MEKIEFGKRFNYLVEQALLLRSKGLPRSVLDAQIRFINNNYCDPPMKEYAIRNVLRAIERRRGYR